MSPFPKPETGWFSVTPRAGCCAPPPAQAPETGARAAARLRARRCAFPSRPWSTMCRTYSRARTECAGVGVADDLSAAHGDQIRIAPERGAHACGECFDIRHGALKCDGRLFHVGCIDRAQRGRVAQTRGAQIQGVRVHTFFTFRCRRSLRARARTGRSHRSRPMPCSASRSRTPCAPDRDSTARRAHDRAATPW